MAPSFAGLLVAGILTFASPCVLPLIPAYLAALGGGVVAPSRGRLVLAATAFALGMSLVFVVLGAAASAVGVSLLAHRGVLMFASGVVMVLFGLRALGILRMPLLDREARPVLARVRTGGSLLAAFLFGAAFAIGWSPCVGPLLASALGYAASHSSSPWRGAGFLAVYSLGIAIPLVVTAALADMAVGWLRRSAHLLPKIERATGVLLVGAGLWTAHDSRVLDEGVLSDASAKPCPGQQGCDLRTGAPRAANVPVITGPRLIELVSQNCPACRRMAPVLARAEAACDGLGARTMRVDVGTAEGLALARSLRVVATPTVVLIGPDGLEHSRLIGEQPFDEIEAAVESAFGLRCTAGPDKAPSAG
jgi:cytochrome c-type biogenesis protein